MNVFVEWNQIGYVCGPVKTPSDLIKNKDKLCGGGPGEKCLMCKAIKIPKEMPPIPEKERIKGIVNFLEYQKTKRVWRDMTPLEKLGQIAIFISDKPDERKLISKFGGVR
eukprot:15946624-Heterocapsa_arctica.AAC.1